MEPLPDDSSNELAEKPVSDIPTTRMLSWARNSAIYRLSKRMHTEKQLRQAITRKAREKFEDIGDRQVEALAAFAVKFGYDNSALDDQAYAEVATRSAQRSGRSKRAISQRLVIKGIDRETASEAVADVNDLRAAVVLARKRAFGPFRRVELDQKRKAKELASFARAGFSSEIGRQVFEMHRDDAEVVLSEDVV
ncbi:recombination regulator RecX [Neorhizobium sp. DAR64872/K0K18]|uniref:recombination regulator RecX n=2 Tax=unclassified Neorhizobium TaxID=2629175 RepID=UPI003D27773E